MGQAAQLPFLNGWQNFYVIIGTAAATLTGLMFVATSLSAGIQRNLSILDAGISAFSTPTVVHFGVVLLSAGILSAPWPAVSTIRLVLGLPGLAAAIYMVIVMQRMRRIPTRPTPLKDWLWYMAFPLAAYIILIAAAMMLPANPGLALYIISAAMVLILFLGIHNAWDLVTYFAVVRSQPERTRKR